MSEAVVAPDCSITSGATVVLVNDGKEFTGSRDRTPVWTAYNCSIAHGASGSAACNTEVSKFNTSIFVSEDICAFDVPMNDALIM